jgi:hypothetical protein
MAARPGAAPIQPPPDLPNMPDVSPTLSNWLRRFSLWATSNINDCLSKKTAASQIYLTSTTGNTVWRVTIDDTGALQTSQLTPGMTP